MVAINHDKEAVITVQLIVQGSITDVQALYDLDYGFGYEAVRVIKES